MMDLVAPESGRSVCMPPSQSNVGVLSPRQSMLSLRPIAEILHACCLLESLFVPDQSALLWLTTCTFAHDVDV